MSFRKRNIGISSSSSPSPSPSAHPTTLPTTTSSPSPPPQPSPPSSPSTSASGIRPSPLSSGIPTTSTGLSSLDGLLAGHGGLPLGTSLLIEEGGTTDYAGAVARFFAAEGAVQRGQRVWVVGVGVGWGRELPGVVGGGEGSGRGEGARGEGERMKIAWRYERLGRGGGDSTIETPQRPSKSASKDDTQPFCHTFDLTKRLEPSAHNQISFLPLSTSSTSDNSPFQGTLSQLSTRILASPPETVHRIVIPSLLSPAIYPPHASQPQHVLQFLHSLRALLRQHPRRLTAIITLPLALFPRSTGLVRWIELLSDGVIELTPFPHSSDVVELSGESGSSKQSEEQPQGMFTIHRLPIFHERGGGSHVVGEDWVFTLSRRRFNIKPFNLPPIEGDTEAQQGNADSKMPSKSELEF